MSSSYTAARAADRPHPAPAWYRDFSIENGVLTIHKTGATARVDPRLLLDVAAWLRFHAVVRARMAWNRVRGRTGPAIWFAPEHPRLWYMIRTAMAWNGMRVAKTPADADIAMHFDDATWSPAAIAPGLSMLNGRCLDISKGRVAELFGEVFGYPLALDPLTHRGLAVEKSEINSLHDGRIVQCPTPPRPGSHYQRLVETGAEDRIEDLRTHCIGGRPVAVWRKVRTTEDRFRSIRNISVEMASPDAVYSPEEQQRIAALLDRLGLDWGTLDILRDRHDGRIYVVDANKTDVGPVLVLSLADKIRSCRVLADALEEMIARKLEKPCQITRSAA